MTNAQTEARAIARRLKHVRIDSDTAIDIIATALAAKDAELEGVRALLRQEQDGLNREIDARAKAEAQLAEAHKALTVAVDLIMTMEPGDSRAVSPLAVALAAVSCGVADQACWDLIDDAARRAREAQGASS